MTDHCRTWKYFPGQVVTLTRTLFIFSGNWPFLFKLQTDGNLIIKDKIQCCKSLPVPSELMHISEPAHSSILKPRNPFGYKRICLLDPLIVEHRDYTLASLLFESVIICIWKILSSEWFFM